jgi:F420H(2)-dependent quinone reductase
VDPVAEAALRDASEVELVTRGRTSGRPHSVTLIFAYDDGVIWLRTDERPPPPDASGVRRRSGRERDPDWLRNLAAGASAEVRVGALTLAVRYEAATDEASDLRRVVELMRAKYGADWVEDWYVDRGRVAVKLRVG